jgi:hypothetical protein
VIERAHDEVPVVVAHADLLDHVGDGVEPGLLPVALGALRLAGRAGGVDDHAAAVAAGDLRRLARRLGAERVVVAVAAHGAVAGADHEHGAGDLRLRARLGHRVLERRVDDRRGGLGVAEDVRDLAGLEPVADLHRGAPDARERLLRDQVLEPVGEHQSDAVAALDPAAHERVAQLVDLRVELAPGQPARRCDGVAGASGRWRRGRRSCGGRGEPGIAVLDERFLVRVVERVEHGGEVWPELRAAHGARELRPACGVEVATETGRTEHAADECEVVDALAEAIEALHGDEA